MGERNDGIGVGCRIDGWRICSSRPPDRAPAIRPVNQARAARPSRVHAARPCRYWTMYRRLLRHRTCGASRARRGNQLWAVLPGHDQRARPTGTTNGYEQGGGRLFSRGDNARAAVRVVRDTLDPGRVIADLGGAERAVPPGLRREEQLWAVLSGRYPRARPPGTTNRRGNRHDQQALGHARRALCLVGGAARARQLSNGKDSCPRLVLLTGAQAGTLRPPMHAHCHRPTKRERVWQPFLVCIARLREAHSSLPEGGLHCVARLRRRGVAASGGRATARSVTESDANTSLRPGMHCEGGTSERNICWLS